MALNPRSLLRKPYADPIRMQKSLQKVGIPRTMRDRIVVGAKSLLAPGEVSTRQQKARELPKPECAQIADFREHGSGLLDSETMPARAAAAAMQSFYDDMNARGAVRKPDGQRKAEFLVQLAGNQDVLSIEAARDFALSDELLSLSSHYFGEVPVLSRIDLWWSPPNESKAESQLYHYDGEDKSQLKVILNVNDVDAETGPFTFVDAPGSTKVAGTRRHSARLDDDEVENIAGQDAVTSLIGPSGTVGAVDTSRCLHYGSRGNSKARLILMIQFTRFLAPKASMPDWSALLAPELWAGLDGSRKLLLNVA